MTLLAVKPTFVHCGADLFEQTHVFECFLISDVFWRIQVSSTFMESGIHLADSSLISKWPIRIVCYACGFRDLEHFQTLMDQ